MMSVTARGRAAGLRVLCRCASSKEQGGQSMFEVAVLVAAVSLAVTAMTVYVSDAIGANVKSVEMQLNGGMQDNRP